MAHLVKICLQEMNLCLVLQQSWPILFCQFLLTQYHLDVPGSVICFRVLNVDLAEEFKLDMVRSLLGI